MNSFSEAVKEPVYIKLARKEREYREQCERELAAVSEQFFNELLKGRYNVSI